MTAEYVETFPMEEWTIELGGKVVTVFIRSDASTSDYDICTADECEGPCKHTSAVRSFRRRMWGMI